MQKALLAVLFSLCFVASQAQIFTDTTNGIIPDNTTSAATFPITVIGVGTLSGSLGLASITVNINHPFSGDLIIRLQSPNKTIVTLSNQNGGSGANYTNTTFTYNATIGITKGIAPFSSTYLPEDSLGKFNNGQAGDGVWYLMVQDVAAGEVGSLINWSINFNKKPAPPLAAIPKSNNILRASGTCDSAPILNSLSVFSGNTSMSYAPPKKWAQLTNAFCGSIENCSFVRFIATATTANFNLWVYNSQQNLGLQLYIWSGLCKGMVTGVGCFNPISPSNSSQPISLSGLVPGLTYFIMFDGYAGDVCDYTLVPVSGVSDGTILMKSATTVCKGRPVNINITGIVGATYSWTSSASPSGFDTTKGATVNINTAVLPAGKNTITVNGLFPNAANYAKGIFYLTVVDTPTILNQPTPIVQTSTLDSGLTALSAFGHSQVGGDKYQWFKNVLNINKGGDSISGAVAANYLPPSNALGNLYYYCIVTNKIGCKSTTNTATVAIIPATNIILTQGTLSDQLNNPVNNLSINIKGNVLGSLDNLQLNNLPYGNYTIKPTKNNDSLKTNGVSSLDLLLTMGHVLNKFPLNSHYKLIAADVNGDKHVTVLDLVLMKRLILGVDTSFTQSGTSENRTWAFVDSAYVFANPSNPFPYKDSITINQTSGTIAKPSFIAIKLGDVNWDRDITKNLLPTPSPANSDNARKNKLKVLDSNFIQKKRTATSTPNKEKIMD